MLFRYKGFDKLGKRAKGTVSASSQEEASHKLKGMGIYYEMLEPTKEFNLDILSSRQMPAELLALFSKELSSYLNSGMAVLTAIKLMENQHQGEKRFTSFLNSTKTMIDEGKSLYQAIKSQSVYTLPDFYLQSLKVAGEGGKMIEVLTNMAEFFSSQNKVKKQVKSAMIYPSAILVVAIGIIGFLLTVVVPQITQIFDDTGQELPHITQVVLSISEFLQAHYKALLVGMVLFVIAIKVLYAKSTGFKTFIDSMFLKIPITGNLIQNHELGRFSYILALMLDSGVAYAPAVALAKDTFANSALSKLFNKASTKVQEGNKLSNSLHILGIVKLKRNFTQSLALGEESSEVAQILSNVSRLYAEENDEKIKILLSLLNPLMMLLIGGFVGVIISAMMLPIMTMSQGLQ